MILVLALLSLVLATIPAAMFIKNLPLFCEANDSPFPDHDAAILPAASISAASVSAASVSAASVSVLIPARDEATSIADSVSSALASENVVVEVIVLDDHSSDATASIVRSIGNVDSRVRLIIGEPLPGGWNGKQHACFQLAKAAKYDRLVFLDADVRLNPPALSRLAARQDRMNLDLLSAFPHQETGTWLEKWIIPMMHYVLLGYLPLARMRASHHPSYAAGCGQLFMTKRSAYDRAGTHAEIKSSRHDGLKLPRAYRENGLSTDVIDGTDLAECRMYHSAAEVVRGVLKNAVEGIAYPKLIVLFSVLLLGASVLPVMTFIVAIAQGNQAAAIVSLIGVVVGHLPRGISAKVFRQPIIGVIFHSMATLIFVVLQWVALANHLRGRQVLWRGRE